MTLFADDEGDDSEEDERAGLLNSPAKAQATKQLQYGNRPALGLMSITTIAYFSVSGGPFGLEMAVAAAGPAAVIAMLVLLTLIWALPCALMTAELSSALPSRAGYMHWVDRGLGPGEKATLCSSLFAPSPARKRRHAPLCRPSHSVPCAAAVFGGLNGWVSLLGSAVDSSTYPSIFCDYLVFALNHWAGVPMLGASSRFSISAALTLLMLGLNLRGITLAARASIALAVFSIAPFGVMLFLLAFKTPIAAVVSIRSALNAGVPQPNLPLGLSVLLWSTSGFDAVSLVSSEVVNTARTIPRAMMISLLMMLAATLLPILICCAAEGASFKWETFGTGSFSLSAERLGGVALGGWVAAAGMSACAGLLNSFMCTSARGFQAMAAKGMLPAVLREERGAEGTPVAALVFTCCCIMACLVLPLTALIELDMSLYTLSLAMELASFLRLRWSEPHLHRPYRVPLGRRALLVVYLPSIALCLVNILVSLRNVAMCLAYFGMLGTGLLLYHLGPRLFLTTFRDAHSQSQRYGVHA